MHRDAFISDSGLFRYWLERQWGPGPRLVFIMLNPSTADAMLDDATIRKCIGFAQRLGFDGILVLNLFAFRATKPANLKLAGWPVGNVNDWIIRDALVNADLFDIKVVCAWGANARGHKRSAEVLALLRACGVQPMALRRLNDGTPEHPLYIPYECVPEPL